MITGAVLAGGKSLRFGRNKALEKFEGKRLLERAIESVRPFCDRIIVVVNEIEPYRDIGVTLASDIIRHQGPLGGIYTALLFSPAEWVLVKAVDMPFLVPGLASLLIDAKLGFDAVVPEVNDAYDPLLALYNRRCIPAIARQLGSPDDRRVIGFYRKIKLRTVAEKEWRKVDPGALSFRNVNTPSDLAELDGLEKS
jgi:molybdopterin-guanine dinucleotide biosynthesis protein A